MSRLAWFRLYTEARTDRKLDTLSDAEHRVWFALMCYAFEQNGRRMVIECSDRDELAVECARGDTDLLDATIAKLVKPLKVLAVDGDEITFINGEARQYDKPSDMPESTQERQSRSREPSPVSRAVTPCHAEPPLEESRGEKSRSKDKPLSLNEQVEVQITVPSDVLGYWEGKAGRDPKVSDARSLRTLVKNYGPSVTKLAIGQACSQGAAPDDFGLITTIARAESA